MSKTQNCEICSAISDYHLTINNYKHFRCSSCGHTFVYPKPSQKILDSFYQKGNYYNSAETQRLRLLNEAQNRIEILDRFRQQLQLNKKLLDVGCASGYFLSVAKDNRWDVTGIDRSDTIAQRALMQSNATIVKGIIENNEIPGAPFPIVTAWEVLEHVVNPVSFFKALTKNVSTGGLLAISTPLANGLPAKALGARFPMLTPPEHLSIFTRKSLGILASKFGFKEIYYKSFSNLGFKSLASGYYKYMFGDNLSSAGVLTKLMFNIFGLSSAWITALVDTLGYGTEMLIIFKRRNI